MPWKSTAGVESDGSVNKSSSELELHAEVESSDSEGLNHVSEVDKYVEPIKTNKKVVESEETEEIVLK